MLRVVLCLISESFWRPGLLRSEDILVDLDAVGALAKPSINLVWQGHLPNHAADGSKRLCFAMWDPWSISSAWYTDMPMQVVMLLKFLIRARPKSAMASKSGLWSLFTRVSSQLHILAHDSLLANVLQSLEKLTTQLFGCGLLESRLLNRLVQVCTSYSCTMVGCWRSFT